MTTPDLYYLGLHAATTVGTVVIFLIRNEHRITKIETRLDYLEKSHDTLTARGTVPHASDPHDQPK